MEDLDSLIALFLQRMREDSTRSESSVFKESLERAESFAKSEGVSGLEKALYLLLERFSYFYGTHYFVAPSETVRVDDVCGDEAQREYEIDFAVYSGSVGRPVKIAIECDGVRSHRQRHSDRDRHKDINLQAAGWIVVRFGSHEIHDELRRTVSTRVWSSHFVDVIERIIFSRSDQLHEHKYVDPRVRTQLTGLPWGRKECECGHSQDDILDKKTHCRRCGAILEKAKAG